MYTASPQPKQPEQKPAAVVSYETFSSFVGDTQTAAGIDFLGDVIPNKTTLYTDQPLRKPLITEAMIDEFLECYEMIGESEDGRDACYMPNGIDRVLIKDAVMGLLAFADQAAQGIKGARHG